MYFKNNVRKEINSLSVKDLHDRLNAVNLDLMKANVLVSKFQNPYGDKLNNSKKTRFNYDVKKLRYVKSLISQRLLLLNGGA